MPDNESEIIEPEEDMLIESVSSMPQYVFIGQNRTDSFNSAPEQEFRSIQTERQLMNPLVVLRLKFRC